MRTFLYDTQAATGGKMIDFHGWDMAVQFAGITQEHQAVRTGAGAFDLGHMGRLHFAGPGALAFLSRQVCRPLADMKFGAVRYGLVLATDGTVEDDVLVSRESAESWHVVVNAGNLDKLKALWAPLIPADVQFIDLSPVQGMVAIQGPKARALLAGLGLDGSELKYYQFKDVAWRGTTVRLSRTGYTGEDGCECFLPQDRVVELWQAAIQAGAVPCGLGCRDTLRLEAGMPLYGNELDRTVTPVQAGLGFAVAKSGGFQGAETVLAELAAGPARKLVGLKMHDKRVPRHGYPVLVDGQPAGVITSGTLSPTLGFPLGMAYVPSAAAIPGTRVEVDIRGTRCAAEVVALPFYKRA